MVDVLFRGQDVSLGPSEPSLVTNYQNKYTFHRSLAVLFSLLAWISLLSFVFHFCEYREWWFLVTGAISLSLLRLFSGSYLHFWTLLGDAVIAELLVEFSRKEAR